jgi:hypothetical protein
LSENGTPASKRERRPDGDSSAPHEGGFGADTRQLLAWVGAVIAPLTLLTALAYYFGWRRERAFAGYFGIDPSVLGLSTSDYVLRSVGPLFAPLAALLLFGFAVMCARVLLAGKAPPSWLVPLAAAAGIAALVIGIMLAAGHGVSSRFIYLQAFAPAVGVILLAYALSQIAGARDPYRGAVQGLHYLTVSVVLVSLFWGTAEYADSRGTKGAERLAKDIDVNPSVTIFSKQNLNITPGDYGESGCSMVFASKRPRSDYPYTYRGFTLLLRNGGDWYVTPTPDLTWAPYREPVLIIPDDDSVRVELERGQDYPVKPLEGTISASSSAVCESAARVRP